MQTNKINYRNDLDKLTAFPADLVFAHDPEKIANSELTDFQDSYYLLMQHYDLLNAYLYVEKTILPRIKDTGLVNISADLWGTWIQTIHQRIAAHLLEGYGEISGKYKQDGIIFRWQPNNEVGAFMQDFLNLPEVAIVSQLESFCQECSEKFGQSSEDFLKAIQIIQKIYNDPTFLQKEITTIKNHKGINKLIKLHEYYHADKLTQEEKVMIRKITKISTQSSRIPSEMKRVLKELTDNLRQLDLTNIDSITHFLAETFYNLVEVHPFANGNGRTATCFMNMLLKAMGLPAIQLRNTNDKIDPDSLYSQAMLVIEESREPLTQLIKLRIESPAEESAERLHYKELNILRVEMFQLYKSIITLQPTFDFTEHLNTMLSESHADEIEDEGNPRILECIRYCNHKLTEELRRLESIIKVKSCGLFAKSEKDSKKLILEQLQRLSMRAEWKGYKHNVFLYQHESKAEVEQIQKLLPHDACKMAIMKNPQNGNFVLQITDIQIAEFIHKENHSLSKTC